MYPGGTYAADFHGCEDTIGKDQNGSAICMAIPTKTYLESFYAVHYVYSLQGEADALVEEEVNKSCRS